MKKLIKSLSDAHLAGAKGEGLRQPDPNRVLRLAHRLGRRQLASVEKDNNALTVEREKVLNRAIETAQGPNQTALNIIKTTALLPEGAGTASFPTWGTDIKHPGGSTDRQWLALLVAGEDKDPSKIEKTPVQGLGSIHIKGGQWGEGVNIPVDNLLITCTTPLLDGMATGPTATDIYINRRPYDLSFPQVPEDEIAFTTEMTMQIDPQGNVSAVGLKRNDGYTIAGEGLDIQVDAFLEGVQQHVEATALAYRQMTEDL